MILMTLGFNSGRKVTTYGQSDGSVALAVRPEDLSLISGNQMVKRKNQLLKVVL